jgi:hypothetical protein
MPGLSARSRNARARHSGPLASGGAARPFACSSA